MLRRIGWCALTLALAANPDPHRFPLAPVGQLRGASGAVMLVPAWSPFGIAVSADGRTTYDLTISVRSLPSPATLGDYRAYVAWLATPDLDSLRNLGAISAERPIAAQTELNKFIVFVSAEKDPRIASRRGPLILVGRSPSALMQSFAGHPFYNTGTPP